MTNSFSLVLALCVGQVPASTTLSPYAPTYNQPGLGQTVSQPVYSSAPANKGPVRNWMSNVFGGRPQFAQPHSQAPMSFATNPGQSASPYAVVPVHPVTPTYLRTTHPVQKSQPIPVTPAQLPVAYTHEEATVPVQVGEPQVIEEPIVVHQSEPMPVTVTETVDPGQVYDANAANLQVAKRYENQIGHETDYSWITGHLFYVHADGGRWVVRYALPDEVDKYGGSVVLAPGVEMKNYREGDLICIYGQVIHEGPFSASLRGALYRVDSILMIERADP
jgi:hypothetical protein